MAHEKYVFFQIVLISAPFASAVSPQPAHAITGNVRVRGRQGRVCRRRQAEVAEFLTRDRELYRSS